MPLSDLLKKVKRVILSVNKGSVVVCFLHSTICLLIWRQFFDEDFYA